MAGQIAGQDMAGKTCPYCQAPVKLDEQVVVCDYCKIPHHLDCWQANGGCTTFGCTVSQPVHTTPTTAARATVADHVDSSGLTFGSHPNSVPSPNPQPQSMKSKAPVTLAANDIEVSNGVAIGAIVGFIFGITILLPMLPLESWKYGAKAGVPLLLVAFVCILGSIIGNAVDGAIRLFDRWIRHSDKQ